jgi:hypothetical protein
MGKSTFLIGTVVQLLLALAAYAATWDCEILPSEQKEETDPQSGARVIFVTTHPAPDTNFYFHERCFLWDDHLILFNSERFGRGDLMGYLTDTGELVRLTPARDPGVGARGASIRGNRIYVSKSNGIYEWVIEVDTQPRTAVRVTEQKLMDLPKGARQRSSLDENCDGTLLTYIYCQDDEHYIGFFDLASGQSLPPTRIGFKPDHLQFHRHRPDIVSFCCVYDSDVAPLDPNEPRHARIWTMNVRTRQPIPAFYQVPGEITTHECWWVNDQMTFTGGFHHEGDREEGTVKVLDFKTGAIQIIGSGAWLDGIPGKELSKVNWWHACGSPDGRWVAADNWHGIVALFDARTTEKRILTTGHRVYGSGSHLHVGWDLRGRHVEFTSNRLGNPDVCVVAIPEDWQRRDNAVPSLPITAGRRQGPK